MPKKIESVEPVKGRVLVDVPRLGLKSGDFATLEPDVASALSDAGDFDAEAVEG